VSGSSGVGKTTLSKLIESVIGVDKVVCLSGDDLHKWERDNCAWNTKTHLNPESNVLHVGHEHIVSLMNGESVLRVQYNHDTGKFDPPVKIEPKQCVLYEGLHALYHKPTSDLADVKIFVDTDTELKTEWKIKRDTKKRGYTEDQVIDTMKRRIHDEELYITPQRKNADIIVKFTKDRMGSVCLEYVNITDVGSELMSKVKDFYDSLNEFMGICKSLSLDPSLVQGRGGNVSIKSKSGLIIKASGSMMGDINLYHGFCVCHHSNGSVPSFDTDDEYNNYVTLSKKSGFGRPSMEMGFHDSIKERVIIHTHPIHLNVLLCSREGKPIINGLFKDLSYKFIEYQVPGRELMNRIGDSKGILFLENHGLIVSAVNAKEALSITNEINNRCKMWLGNHYESFVDVSEDDTKINLPLFPDAAVFPVEMSSTNNYILRLMTAACLTPKFLNRNQIRHLNNMTSEKHRKTLV
jgi:uridine kinase/ribulose-5-phosphate 4-epimerase/fuculose-1-phosphate aldolase